MSTFFLLRGAGSDALRHKRDETRSAIDWRYPCKDKILDLGFDYRALSFAVTIVGALQLVRT
jgi:hypothetical protein